MSEVIVETTELLNIFKTGVTQSVALVEHMPDAHRIEAWTFWKEISKLVVYGVEEVMLTGDGKLANILCLSSIPENSSAEIHITESVNIQSVDYQSADSAEHTEQELIKITEQAEGSAPSVCANQKKEVGGNIRESGVNAMTSPKNDSIISPTLISRNSEGQLDEKLQCHTKAGKDFAETPVTSSPDTAVRKSKRTKSDTKVYESIIPKSRKRLKCDKENLESDSGHEQITSSTSTEKTSAGKGTTINEGNKTEDDPGDYAGGDDVSFSDTSSIYQETLPAFQICTGEENLAKDTQKHTSAKNKRKLKYYNKIMLKNLPPDRPQDEIIKNFVENVSADIEIIDSADLSYKKPAPCRKRKTGCQASRTKTTISKEERRTCPVCSKVLSNYSNLKVHLRSHSGEKPFMCGECGRNFSTRPNLVRHERTHRGEKPYECPDCHKHFTEKKSMRIHRRIHTGELPYQCQVCLARFSQSGTLAAHMNIHTGTKSHLCDLCGKAFRQKTQLRLHYLRHDNIRNHSCTVCHKAFISKGERDRHAVRHSGERPYKCNVCPKKFTRRQYVKEHMNKHTGAKPYPCKLCGLHFSDLASCSRHLKKHEDKMQLLAKIDGEETYVVYLDADQLLQASRGEKALVLGENGSLNLEDIQVDEGSQDGNLGLETTQTIVADEISSETSFLVEIQKPPSDVNNRQEQEVLANPSQGKDGSKIKTSTTVVHRLELEKMLLAEQLKDNSNIQISEVTSIKTEDGSNLPQEPVIILQSSEET